VGSGSSISPSAVAVADLLVTCRDACPLLGSDDAERGGEEDLLLLVDHVVDHRERIGQRRQKRRDVAGRD
jgi:hypothetical protein